MSNKFNYQFKPRVQSLYHDNIKSYIFWDTMPCSPLKANRCFGAVCRLHLQTQRINQAINQHEGGSKQADRKLFLLHAGFLPTYFLTVKMEVARSSETSVDFQRTIWHYIPEYFTVWTSNPTGINMIFSKQRIFPWNKPRTLLFISFSIHYSKLSSHSKLYNLHSWHLIRNISQY
jgi:hypothetical protein